MCTRGFDDAYGGGVGFIMALALVGAIVCGVVGFISTRKKSERELNN